MSFALLLCNTFAFLNIKINKKRSNEKWPLMRKALIVCIKNNKKIRMLISWNEADLLFKEILVSFKKSWNLLKTTPVKALAKLSTRAYLSSLVIFCNPVVLSILPNDKMGPWVGCGFGHT